MSILPTNAPAHPLQYLLRLCSQGETLFEQSLTFEQLSVLHDKLREQGLVGRDSALLVLENNCLVLNLEVIR